ncbi:epoxide hydrolase [Pseudomonas seleniipraecipitans]|uniref:Epoxide hydrolase n=1 Tax=Phytopseudomonas seleniipraecipitans TaxID=640205 RepID=A0ABY5J6T7_9GAMM|nr:epoxide hydrolase family protein [Pseudomonas seleniipraecipitans]UUD63647.1 epoxide hydrolase [Pseudomonas seleniipraecipitans]
MSLKVKPFKIDIPHDQLLDLEQRLARMRWPATVPGSRWSYGLDLNVAKQMVAYWKDGFDWRRQEAKLNAFPQFTTTIDGQTIHFIHARSPEPTAQPLILTHGWPSTFADFAEMIGPLTDPRRYGGDPADAFDVVVPSIPGFGFSGPTQEPGWDSAKIARAWDTLMRGLGYDRYGAHGGDAGSFITREMGIAKPDGLLAIHVLEIFAFPTGVPGELDELTAAEREQMEFMAGFNERSCHQAVHQKRPLTLGYGLADSPVGQLAWICDPMMGLGRYAPPESHNWDTVLTNVSIYWFTNTAESSARWYLEDAQSGAGGAEKMNSTPTGVALFPYNLLSIRKIAERGNNIVHWSSFDRGGHFAAIDVPELLVGDLRKFFREFRQGL